MFANIYPKSNRLYLLPFVALPDFASNNLADSGKDDVARQTEKVTAMTVVTILIVDRILRRMTVFCLILAIIVAGGGNPFLCRQTFEEENRPTHRTR